MPSIPLRATMTILTLLAACIVGGSASAQSDYARSTNGTRWLESPNSDLSIKILVEAANLGGTEVELGEITFPPGPAPARGHLHEAVEIFYVLEGELDHIVNDESHVLTSGMVGIVRPGDQVIHKVNSATPVKALVIWAPGGEASRIAQFFEQRPIREGDRNDRSRN